MILTAIYGRLAGMAPMMASRRGAFLTAALSRAAFGLSIPFVVGVTGDSIPLRTSLASDAADVIIITSAGNTMVAAGIDAPFRMIRFAGAAPGAPASTPAVSLATDISHGVCVRLS